jgi:CRISPR-associated protein Cmr6
MESYKNIGLLFYNHYFKGLNLLTEKSPENETKLSDNNKALYASTLDQKEVPDLPGDLQSFKLTTIYPGLFSGSGYAHESSVLGELKLGFYFDYTSGLPCIPGSSVKGIIKSAFEHSGYVRSILNELGKGERKSELQNDFKAYDNAKINKEFVDKIFGSEDTLTSIYERDIFFDAFPVTTGNEEGKFLDNDYITPHKHPKNPELDPFTNPTPLQFLKVLPQVEFQFNFKLVDTEGMSAQMKQELFRQILLDIGIGAKTNVGYGQFEQKENEDFSSSMAYEKILEQAQAREANRTEEDNKIVTGKKLKCKIIEINKKKIRFKFDWGKQLEFSKKKSSITGYFQVGDIVEIEINNDYYITKKVLFNNNIKKIEK